MCECDSKQWAMVCKYPVIIVRNCKQGQFKIKTKKLFNLKYTILYYVYLHTYFSLNKIKHFKVCRNLTKLLIS